MSTKNDELRLYPSAIVRRLTAQGIARSHETQQVVEMVDAPNGRCSDRYEGGIT